MIQRLRTRARELKAWSYALYLACKDPRVPWYARVFALGVVAYALSPIDLIPDFIPVIGFLDDLVVVPLGIALAIKMIPRPVLDECREQARLDMSHSKAVSWVGAGFIVALWLLLAVLAGAAIVRSFER